MDEEIKFTEAELWKAINDALGEDGGEIPTDPQEVDPGTITSSELACAKMIGPDKAREILNHLTDDVGIFVRDPRVKRRDRWTGNIVHRKGYRFVGSKT